MAEGILKFYGADRFEVFSAGTRPSHVNATAVRVMKEIGIDISGQRSKNLREFDGQPFDFVITVCDNAKESCPVFPGGGRYLHWPFPDPPHEKEINDDVLQEFRRVRDLIHARFKQAAGTGRFE